MAMSNNQKETKLKASIGEFVGPLLRRLELAKKQAPKDSKMEEIIDQISREVLNIKYNFHSGEKLEIKLTGFLGKIERHIDYLSDHNGTKTQWDEHNITDLEDIINQLSQNPRANPPEAALEKASDLRQTATITEVMESSNRSCEQIIHSTTLEWMESFDPKVVWCLYSLGIFPENTELKKRFIIYWWIALGLIPFSGDTCRIIERGELFFSFLVGNGFIIPVNTREHNQLINSYTISPIIYKQLISACERDGCLKSEKGEEGTWHLYKDNKFNMNVLLNQDQHYLNSKDISSKHDFQVVHLGSCPYTETNACNGYKKSGSEDHIEVDDTHFFMDLGKNVTYLSLQGISRIAEVHESIGKLKYLKILDLKACHNLEKLPEKPSPKFTPKLIRSALPQESWFKKLIVLDISECYLLDFMPKWVCELSNLEVLKGFVVGGVGNKNQSCQLGDLSELKRLWKLSIRIATEHSVLEDFSGLEHLLVLSIMWRGNKDNNKKPTYSLPKNLEKLDIRCYPRAETPELLNPAELKNLKRLYIRGGNLAKIPCNGSWEVEILRLRFLKDLVYPNNWNELKHSFKNLKYVEYVECPKPENFPNVGSSWCMEKDESFERGKTSFERGETSNQS